MTQQYTPTVLIVDDVNDNIQVVAHHLRNKGYELLFANDGQTALDTLTHGPVDLILLDVMMPGLNGFDTCKRIKDNPATADIPVIFLTAKADTASLVEGFRMGGIDYVTKPFSADELLARVGTHLRLREGEKQLRAFLAAKDRFLSIIANQLSTPFSGLQGALKMIVRDFHELPQEDLEDYLQMAGSAADTVGGILANLSSWARLQNNQFGYSPREIPLTDLLQETASAYQLDAELKNITIKLDLSPETQVHGDPEMLEMIFGNLISNAIKYSKPGDEVNIQSTNKGSSIDITITDSGEGIPQADINNLFDLENQLKRAGTAGEGGSGLGLMLSRELAERHGGTLYLKNRDEQSGIVACVTLPTKSAKV